MPVLYLLDNSKQRAQPLGWISCIQQYKSDPFFSNIKEILY
jgi:hypothetical protein